MTSHPRDRAGNLVHVGAHVRLLSLSGNWLEELPHEEKPDVLSMIGEVFEVEEIDDYGRAWISKSWPNEKAGLAESMLLWEAGMINLLCCVS